MANPKISEAEWQVMQVVWGRKAATASDVIEELLPETGWSHRTIRTLLSRLVEKGVLATQPSGNRYVYRPLIARSKCIRDAGRSFLNRVFGGDTGELLVHFVKHEKMSPEQVQKLKQLLDDKRDKGD